MTYRAMTTSGKFDYSNDYAELAARNENSTIQARFDGDVWLDCEARDDCERFQRLKNFR